MSAFSPLRKSCAFLFHGAAFKIRRVFTIILLSSVILHLKIKKMILFK